MVWARQANAPASAARGAVYFSRTTNGGPTWSKARAIYQSPLGMETSANQIVVLPDRDLLDVFNELGFDHPRHDRIIVIRSADQGRTWSAWQQVTGHPFDLRTAPFDDGFFLSEYQGLAGAGQRFIVSATWTNGHSLDNRTDIYSAIFAVGHH